LALPSLSPTIHHLLWTLSECGSDRFVTIVDNDIYNFNKTRFIIGIIFAGIVVTTSDGYSKAKLAQPGNREWAIVI